MTLFAGLIELPREVHGGDFVVRLTEGVEGDQVDRTISSYVVTDQLATAFDRALGLVRDAIEARSSKAAILHGSFGSGKSHFMAILHLLLQGDPRARGITALAPVIARHTWLERTRSLVVPFHMIGAESTEQAVLGGYARYIAQHHPEAPTPAVYVADQLFANARAARQQQGDDTFFATLNRGSAGAASGWGALAAAWDADTFEAALQGSADSEDRLRLVQDLLDTHFTAYRDLAQASGSGFVTLDEGLSAISKHAQQLGYDALVLFLDELVLWLASRMADMEFVGREGPKVAKLVESTTADRPIPIVGFVAQQRDLRELVGEHVPGVEKSAFVDTFRWWGGRFDRIDLEDRNLPAIAQRRVLEPRDAAAKAQIDAAFEATTHLREDVRAILMGSDADREMFRQTYPFTPALMKALIAASGALQRERTALRVMQQILVERRDTLQLGELVAVGDLFDAIASGSDPFTVEMQQHFESARRLYRTKLRPALLSKHGITDDEATDSPPAAFRTDDRLVKTLLLAALVPEAEPFRTITATQLAALNYGAVASFVPGEEATAVLTSLQKLALQVSELSIGEGANPSISLKLAGVDTEQIVVKAAQVADTAGARRRLVSQMVLDALGVANQGQFPTIRVDWRGTARDVDMLVGNVRDPNDIADSQLVRPGNDRWLLAVDYPFDEPGWTPADDRARLERLREAGATSRTVCWLPAFFTEAAQADLGRLVVLNHVLEKDRFGEYSSHLSPRDVGEARTLLENQRSTLTRRIQNAVEQAYGIIAASDAVEGPVSTDDLLFSLEPAHTPDRPVAVSLDDAARKLAAQMLDQQFPDHPRYSRPVTPKDLRLTLANVRAAIAHGGRADVAPPERDAVRVVAKPLGVGELHEAHVVPDDFWPSHFTQCRSRDQEAGVTMPITVGRLREWIDRPSPRGLLREHQDLVILLWADRTNHALREHGGPSSGDLGKLPDHLELVPQELPDEASWRAARGRASVVFGKTAPEILSAGNVDALAREVTSIAAEARTACDRVQGELTVAAGHLGVPSDADRLRTGRAAYALVANLAAAKPKAAIEALADADIPTSASALGRSIAQAAEVSAALTDTRWEIVQAAFALTDERSRPAATLRQQLVEALSADELVQALPPVLRSVESGATRLVVGTTPPQPPPPPPPAPAHEKRVDGLTVEAAWALLAGIEDNNLQEPGTSITVIWTERADGAE